MEVGKRYRNFRIFTLLSWVKNFYPSTLSRTCLGVVFGSKLSFKEHIIKTASSCMSALGQISRAKRIFRKDILVTIINSFMFSKLYYCSSIWSNTSASNIRKLQGVQKFAPRIVSGTRKFDHVSPALKDLRWIPVKSNLYLRDAILAFKSMTGQVPNCLSSNFISRGNISGRTTRSSSQLNIPSQDKDLFITEL